MATTLNGNYVNATKAVKAIDKKTGGLWTALGLFTVDISYANGLPAVGTDIKPAFQSQEKQASVEVSVEMASNSTYRVAKSVLVNCVAAGISIVDGKGKLRGKTELEDELKALKEPKSALEKLTAAMAIVDKQLKLLDAKDMLTAAQLLSSSLESTAVVLKLAA